MPEATCSGEPDAGNPHVRFDEGRGTSVPSYSTGSVAAGKNVIISRIMSGKLFGKGAALALASLASIRLLAHQPDAAFDDSYQIDGSQSWPFVRLLAA